MSELRFVHRYHPAIGSSKTTLLLLHGTGGTEEDLIPLGRTLLPGAGLLSVRGNVLENGMPRFFRRLAEGVFDLADLKLRTSELAEFLIQARQQYSLSPHRFIALGYSNGANIASSLMFSFPDHLQGALLLRGMIPFEPHVSPSLHGVPVLLCSGERDPIVPRTNAARLAEIFRKAGATVDIHWHKGGHELGQDDIDAAAKWFQQNAGTSE